MYIEFKLYKQYIWRMGICLPLCSTLEPFSAHYCSQEVWVQRVIAFQESVQLLAILCHMTAETQRMKGVIRTYKTEMGACERRPGAGMIA